MITTEELVRMGPHRALAHIQRFHDAVRMELNLAMNAPKPDQEHIAYLCQVLADIEKHLPTLERRGRA